MWGTQPPGGGRGGRGRVALATGVLALALALLAPALASAADGLWATQRSASAPHNALAFAIGSSDDLLSGPLAAGVADDESYGIALTPLNEYGEDYLYVTDDNSASTISEYSIDPSTAALTQLPQGGGFATADPASGANPESIAVDPTGSWAYSANPGSGSLTAYRIDPRTGVLTALQETTSGLTQPTGVAVDPTGSYVYVADFGANEVDEYSIDHTSGALTYLGQLALPTSTDASSTPEPIRVATAALDGTDYAFVDDAANDLVEELVIDESDGSLSQATWTSPEGSDYPDGSATIEGGPVGLAVNTGSSTPYLYVAAGNVDEYAIDSGTGALSAYTSVADGDVATGVAIAPDGNELYAGSIGANIDLYTIAADGSLSADSTPSVSGDDGPSTVVAGPLPSANPPGTPPGGALEPIAYPNGCVTSDSWGSLYLGCDYDGAAIPDGSMFDSYQPVVSPDGDYAYVASPGGDVDEFSRDPATGALDYVGCVGADAACGSLEGMGGPQEMAISPDGTSAYVVATDGGDGALDWFSRDPGSGLLSWQGCFSQTDLSCTSSVGLTNPYGVTVSPNGKSVYATSNGDSSVVEFSRAPDGSLTAPGSCITTDSSNPGGCATPSAADYGDLLYPLTVVVSPDGENVYVAGGGTGSNGGDVSELARDPTTGALSFIPGSSCITTGDTDYPNCTTTSAIGFDGGSEDLAVSPDGRNVYVNAFGDNGVIELRRNTSTGALTQLAPPNACIAEETSPAGSPYSCTQPTYPQEYGTASALGVAISPDGLDVYVSGAGDNAVASFVRDPSSGALSPVALPFGCLSGAGQYVAGTCPQYNVNGLFQPRRLTVSPDGTSVYVADQVGDGGVGGDGLVELARTLPTADLGVSVSAPSTAYAGSTFAYTLTVTDHGPYGIYAPTLSNSLPSNASFSSVSASQGSCSGTTMLSCDLGAMSDGSSATITVTVEAGSAGSATDGAAIALPSGDVSDPDSANDDATATTTIENAPSSGPAAPVLEQSTDLAPVSGQVLVKLPGSGSFVALSQAESIPMGATIDATDGSVQITTALPNGTTQTGDFYDGEFVVTQSSSGRVFAALAGGSFAGCPSPHAKRTHHRRRTVLLAAAKKPKTAVIRKLWGSAHGAYTTKGRYGSAAVSGTIWLTEDRCDGTFFKVTKDTIVVTAFAKPAKHHSLKQGQSFLVPAP